MCFQEELECVEWGLCGRRSFKGVCEEGGKSLKSEAFHVFWRSDFSSQSCNSSASVVLGKILELSVPSVICESTQVDVYGVGTVGALGAWAWWSFFRNTGADSRDWS